MLSRLYDFIRYQPVAFAATIASAILLLAQQWAGQGIISQDFLTSLTNFLDPTNGYLFIIGAAIFSWFKVTPVAKLEG